MKDQDTHAYPISVDEIDEAPWNAYTWDESVCSIDGADTTLPTKDDVAEVLYHGSSGPDWDGVEAAVVRLNDGRLAAWESTWGPTGSGFSEDAYGGDAEVWFAPDDALNKLVLQALTDTGRRLCGIPKEGLEVQR